MSSTVKTPAQERSIKKITLRAADGDISKKDLRLIKQRFMNLHKIKMQRASEAITPRQQIFLDLLPLLFHVNHPVLPGYVSGKTPAGIADYSPSKTALYQAKTLGKGFSYKKRARRVFAVEALFIMGSVGSIAYAKSSDIDLWLCHSPDLSRGELKLLAKKAKDIEKWAETLGLEVHFFMMNASEFKEGVATPLSTESSGSTQHHLLLEEFYRTALYVAGRYPVWWLVPSEAENDYTAFVDNLLERRFIDRSDVIDFGGLENVPAEEFLGASFWHLYKAIDSPYKSLLKLMLMEAYVAEYPDVNWAAQQMKSAVYNGETDVNKLDAYLILYAALEGYLIRRDEEERLGLMRFCFYSKVNESGKASKLSRATDWRHKVLHNKVKSWGILPEFLDDAIARKPRKINHIQQEKARLTKELTQSYRRLIRFAKDHLNASADGNIELTLLGRKLQAVFEKKPGKLERASSKTMQALQENKVVIRQKIEKEIVLGWGLYNILPTGEEDLLRQAHSLVELLSWGVEYGLLSEKTKIALNPGGSQLSAREVQQTIRDIRLFFRSLPSKAVDLSDYKDKPQISHVTMMLNSGVDPMLDFTEQGVHLTSERSDALSYGAQRRNLVVSIEVMYRNSWGEVLFSKYEGVDGLMASFCHIFDTKSLGRNQKLPVIMCTSHSSPRAMSIAKRVQTLLEEVGLAFKRYKKACSPRYVIQSEHAYYVLQVNAGKMAFQYASNKDKLLNVLAHDQGVYSPIVFDSLALDGHFLPMICAHHEEGEVQVFYYQTGETAEVFIIDEKGSLYHREQGFEDEAILLHPYQSVLESSRERRELSGESHPSMNFDNSDKFYRIEKVRSSWALSEVVNDGLELFLNTQVRVAYDQQAEEPHIYCDEQDFSILEYGEAMYDEAAKYVHSIRKSDSTYPVYVTDIDVPAEHLGSSDKLQTIHYLQYKQHIEEKLNK
jgi:adenylate cyclase class 1